MAMTASTIIRFGTPAAAVLTTLALWGLSVSGRTAPIERVALARQTFAELAYVVKHPRCINCHTSVGFPRQGDDGHRHMFNVARGSDDRGAAAMRCSSCHQSANQTASGVPGARGWRLAPLRMAWEGLSTGDLCRALLDPRRGGMTPAKFVEHLRDEKLVAWAWQPGRNSAGVERSPPPLSRDDFMALARKWVDLGAACPE
jgi:hypothetical protein